jgi:hypothetical protein
LPDGGCSFVEQAATPADRARLIWSSALDPRVLTVEAEPCNDGSDRFDIRDFAERSGIAKGRHEHLMVLDRGRRLRLDIVSGTLLDGPVRLRHILVGAANLEPKIVALHQLSSLCRTGRLSVWRQPSDRRLRRLILALRAFDARMEGATLRGTALGLKGAHVDWPGPGECTKSWVRRLIELGETMARAGPKAILAGPV